MLVQSLSGVIVEIFSSLISDHIVLTAFLTMLVGGGGNASGQTIADLVQRLRTGEVSPADFGSVLAREASIGAILGLTVGACAFPRVSLLSKHAGLVDAVAISTAYAIIVFLANVVAVCVVLFLDRYGQAAVGSPPVVQVVVDVVGTTIACVVAHHVYSLFSSAEESAPS